ncbi:UDP-N-acetylglucosamine 2-epimerase [Polynucleobacter sp. Adler-ghost]|uniref:UDP-N-acetylglucosamine 2-epimerase n=1 Tax=Polynucleobacter sp. Adler-ghost TaxID=2770234 RepID=UPI001BFE54E5|nr:UDP-N-acetylglucosamine 2-epimerase [Polynucleobacter sp. Adler-ghost]QWE31035.1 UDP-N-acetylglucosamine 2-epimerase (hydrolyzing) [Polynucleobacter sp. Adler-ghost]
MNGKRNICVVVASRANYGRIRSLLSALQANSNINLQIVVTASALLYRFGEVIKLIESDGYNVSAKAHVVLEGDTPSAMAKSTGFAIQELTTIFDFLKPDIVLTVADRYETLATAVAASYMNIHVAHTQGGEVTGSIDESVRHAITKLAHFHFVTTELSKKRVIQMGEDPSRVFLTGCPSIDEITNTDLQVTPDLLEKNGGVGATIDLNKPYLLVLQHPVTTEFNLASSQIKETIEALNRIKMPTIWLWPNIDAGSDAISHELRSFRETENPGWLRLHRNFSIQDYARLMKNCACFIGNSSSALREGAYLGTPAINIGSRQFNRERAENVIDSHAISSEIEKLIRIQVSHGPYASNPLFGNGNSGLKIAQILSTVTLGSTQKVFHDL